MTFTFRIDADDLIFPRTATRQGPKFQAVVPPAPDRDAVLTAGMCHNSAEFEKVDTGQIRMSGVEITLSKF